VDRVHATLRGRRLNAKRRERMGCPSCGCTEVFTDEYGLAQCPCCETIWVTDERGIERILIGAEA
jgi:ribosomal protein L37AE/L43A